VLFVYIVGPVCYRKNGHLAVTDANLQLGRIQPDLFPAIFGEKENEPLDAEGTRTAFEALTVQINESMRGEQQVCSLHISHTSLHISLHIPQFILTYYYIIYYSNVILFAFAIGVFC
jgi:N-methylhydantoinase A/oxoprolinase/acetone carboxylase beta subunit